MVWHQLVNGLAAAVAAAIWFRAIGTTMTIAGKAATAATCAVFGITGWYAALYFVLGTGILDLPLADMVPLFRWAFVPLILAAPVRYLTLLNTVRNIVDSVGIANRITTTDEAT